MMQRTSYFFHSPRGFSNEADVYAVESDKAEMWRAAFEQRLGSKADYAETAVESITRQRAAELIRRDGIGLAINPDDYNWEDCTEKKLTPASVRSARRNAWALLETWRKDDEFAAQMDEVYPEFAVTAR